MRREFEKGEWRGSGDRDQGRPAGGRRPGPPVAAGDHEIVQRLQASYESKRCADLRGKLPLPDRRTTPRMIDRALILLFPEYHGYRPGSERFALDLTCQVARLRRELTEQSARAFRFEGKPRDEARRRGERAAANLLGALRKVRRVLSEDVRAGAEVDPAASCTEEILLAYPGLEAIAVYRVAHELHRLGVPLIPRMMTEEAHRRTGIDIHPGALIGPGFFIDHGTGVVIGKTTVIGRNVTLYQGVTLGALSFPRDADGNFDDTRKRHPTLEDHVKVYSNASVLGDIIVGRNSTVGANVWLAQDLPREHIAIIEERELRIRHKAVRKAPTRTAPKQPRADAPTRPAIHPSDSPKGEELFDLYRLQDDGGANCGDVDELNP